MWWHILRTMPLTLAVCWYSILSVVVIAIIDAAYFDYRPTREHVAGLALAIIALILLRDRT